MSIWTLLEPTSYELFLISVKGQQNIKSIKAFGRTVLTTWILFNYFVVVRSWQAVMVKPSVLRSGSSAELTCTYNTHVSEGFTLEWRYASPGTPAVQAKRLLYFNGRVYWVNFRDGRMALVQNPPVSGVTSMRIINAKTSDAGLYICEVTNPNDLSCSGKGLVNLTVLDQHTGFLILHNLSDAFASTYTCKATNELGQAVCSITLRVTHGGSSATAVGGGLMGIFLVLLLIGVTVSYITRNRKEHVQKTYANELSEVNNNSATPHSARN